MPRTKDQASRNVGGNANRDSNGDKQNSRRAAATPVSNPRAKPAPTSRTAPMSSPRAKPAAPARAVRENQAKLNRAARLGDDGPKTPRFAPAKTPRPAANPNRKQKTYPGRTPYNYAV